MHSPALTHPRSPYCEIPSHGILYRSCRAVGRFALGVFFFIREFGAAVVDTWILGKSPEQQMRDSLDE